MGGSKQGRGGHANMGTAFCDRCIERLASWPGEGKSEMGTQRQESWEGTAYVPGLLVLRRLQPVLSSRTPFFSQALCYSHHFPPPFIFSKCVPNLFLFLTARVSSLKREESAKGIFLSPHYPFKAHLGPFHKEIPSKGQQGLQGHIHQYI